jgi:hypothetical protein
MARRLFPREHGAYVQLAAPLLAAFAAFGATFASAMLAIAATSAFVANESLLVVLGHRGKRADKARARRWLAVLVPLAAIAGVAGLVMAPAPIAALVAIPALALVGFAWKKREHTLAGDLVAVVALTGAAVPVAMAAGASFESALHLWTIWSVGFAATVFAVHRVIARRREIDIDAAVVAALAMSSPLSGACAPLVMTSIAVVIMSPHARRLRRIGFVMLGASLISATLYAFA